MTTYFNGRTLGKSLKEVAVDLIQVPGLTTSEEVMSRWYHSPYDVDLFTWLDKGESVIKQQLMVNGQVVEWNCLEGLRTGVIIESGVDDENISENLRFDLKPHSEAVNMAVDILKNIDLDIKVLEQLVDNFKNPLDIKSMPAEDFVKKFGMSLKNYQKADHGFWEALSKSFKSMFKKEAA